MKIAKGMDYEEKFLPVARHSTIAMLFELPVEMNSKFFHLDVKTAF